MYKKRKKATSLLFGNLFIIKDMPGYNRAIEREKNTKLQAKKTKNRVNDYDDVMHL